MQAIPMGILRTRSWADAEEYFFTTGFQRLRVEPVLAGVFAVLALRDVSPFPLTNHYWRLTVSLAVATVPCIPYEEYNGHEGVYEIRGIEIVASTSLGTVDTVASLKRQALDALSWAINTVPHTDVAPRLRAVNQIAQAEYYRLKSEGCRQGVADRLWREHFLDDLDPAERTAMAEWVHEFGDRPLLLRGEQTRHETALRTRGIIAD